jgi:hypothetical protein
LADDGGAVGGAGDAALDPMAVGSRADSRLSENHRRLRHVLEAQPGGWPVRVPEGP